MAKRRHTPQGLKWNTLSLRLEHRIQKVAQSWEGTPYGDGQRTKQQACNCIGLVIGILDELDHRESPTPFPRLRPDAGVHRQDIGFHVIREILKSHPADVVDDGSLEPGDVVVLRSSAQGPDHSTHVLFVTSRPFQALHVPLRHKAVFTTIRPSDPIVAVYRIRNKQGWLNAT